MYDERQVICMWFYIAIHIIMVLLIFEILAIFLICEIISEANNDPEWHKSSPDESVSKDSDSYWHGSVYRSPPDE
jgi:hypothetical protein